MTLIAWIKRDDICYANCMIEVLDTNGVQLLTPGAGIIPACHQSICKVQTTRATIHLALRGILGGQWYVFWFLPLSKPFTHEAMALNPYTVPYGVLVDTHLFTPGVT